MLAALKKPHLAEKAAHITHDIIEDAGNTPSSSPEIANRIAREIRRITGIDDPYENFKIQEMAQAREIVAHLKNHVAESLRSRAILAALGNSLDFFNNPADSFLALWKNDGK